MRFNNSYSDFVKILLSLIFSLSLTQGVYAVDNDLNIRFVEFNQEQFPDKIDLPLPPEFQSLNKGAFTTFTDNFTDSQGRTLMYRYSLPDGINPSIPQQVMIYFHGNNTATQQEIVDSFFPGIGARGQARGIIPVVVASPETRPPPQEGVRQWYDEDKLLIRELILSNFEGNINTDNDKIYFLGGSQGACFLHDFTMEYGENYGGGFFGGCGCYNSPDPLWDPSQEFKDRFKVLIHTTTEDFLYETSQKGYGYYKHTIGLNTRGDLEQAGGHCVDHWSKLDESMDWFTDVSQIPQEPFRPHWKRVSAMSGVKAVTVEPNQTVWLAQESDINTVTIWKSVDKGQNWLQVSQLNGSVKDLDNAGGRLFLSLSGELLRSEDGGITFQSVLSGTFPYNVVTDSNNGIYSDGNPIQYSDDFGDSWSDAGVGNDNFLLNFDPINTGSNPRFLAATSFNSGPDYIGDIANSEWTQLNNTSLGSVHYAALGENLLWGLISENNTDGLFKSIDSGASWSEVILPAVFNNFGNQYTKASVLGADEMVLHGGWNSSWFTDNAGGSWQRVHGLESVLDGRISTVNELGFYLVDYNDGDAVFRFVSLEDEDSIFINGFE